MSKTRILWSGITGKTASEVLKLDNDDNAEIVAGICRSNDKYYNYNQLDEISEEYDVIVDFSHKDCFDKVLDFALKVKKPLIIGTSGLIETQTKKIMEAATKIPIFRGGNFRFEVKKFIDDIVEYAKENDKIELVETHYKIMNLPSETAKVIVKKVKDITGKDVLVKSYLQDKEYTNDWRVGNIHYTCGFYDEKLARDILKISSILKYKEPGSVYDLDRLINEENS